MKQATKKSAAQAAAEEHFADIELLLGHISNTAKADTIGADWSHVGTLGHVRDLLVQAAFAVGAITEEEAHDLFGATL